jgi:hypothetical protein
VARTLHMTGALTYTEGKLVWSRHI